MQQLRKFCNALRGIDVSQLELSTLLQYSHEIQFYITRCKSASLEINSNLQQHETLNDITVDAQQVTKSVRNYNKKIQKLNKNMHQINVEITKLLDERKVDFKRKQMYQRQVDELNIGLSNVVEKQMELKHNITQNRNALITLKTNTKTSKEFAEKLLNQIETISIKSWEREHFINWILCISDGHFSDTKFNRFIDAVRNTEHIMSDTAMMEGLLREWGLVSSDINMFMINYNRLMKKQSAKRN